MKKSELRAFVFEARDKETCPQKILCFCELSKWGPPWGPENLDANLLRSWLGFSYDTYPVAFCVSLPGMKWPATIRWRNNEIYQYWRKSYDIFKLYCLKDEA